MTTPDIKQDEVSPVQATGELAFVSRFAPSPSGRMHAGNIFSALVSWLLAKQSGGKVVLRIEDLDAARSKPEFASQLMRDFENLGLSWDEGPFYQAERQDIYRSAFESLRQQGLVYPCFCTRADLHAASAPHVGERSIYAGTCRMLNEASRERKAKELAQQHRAPSHRILCPDEEYALIDLFQGRFSQNLARDCGDFVIQRSDGAFAYQLAVVIDDAEQGINCVCRGVDLLSSTPQQLYLQSLLALPHPHYAHVPLIMGADGHRLSKRHADANLEQLLVRFKSPRAIIGHIAFLAGIIDSDEPQSPEELLLTARLEALNGKKEIVWR